MDIFLKENGVAEVHILKLEEEGYDLETFKTLDAVILRVIGFKGVDIQRLLAVIAKANENPKPALETVAQAADTEEEKQGEEEVTDKRNQVEDESTDERNQVEEESTDEERLAKYFTSAEYSALSEYEKRNSLGLLSRYEMAIAAGFNSDIIKPSFVKRWETRNKNKNKENQLLNQRPAPVVLSRRSDRVRSQLGSIPNSTLTGPLRDQSNVLPSSVSTGPGFSSVEPPDGRASPSCSTELRQGIAGHSLFSVQSSASRVLPSFPSGLEQGLPREPSPIRIVGANSSITLNSPNVTQQSNEAVIRVNVPMPIANYDCIKPSLPTYDVIKILEDKLEAEGMKPSLALRNLKTKGFLTVKAERKLVMRTLTRYLYSLHAKKPSSTSTEEKEGMAKSFVKAFPMYCGTHDEQNFPWDAIFCKKANTGFIVNASRSIQKINRTRETLKKSVDSPSDLDDNDYDSDEVTNLALLVPGREEKAEIESGMKNTFRKRNASRKRNETISSVLSEFPHLKSYDGEMLKLEFRMMRPNAQDMCRIFLGLQPKILSLPVRHPVQLGFVDDTIKALLTLSQNLPHDVVTRADKDLQQRGVWANAEDIIQVIGTNVDIEVFLAERRATLQRSIQPYILGIKSVVTSKITKFFIVLDHETVQLGQCQTIKAVDHLFICYYIFNRSYPFGWRNTLHFLSTCFYKVMEDPVPRQRPDAVTPSERELWQLLANMS